MDMEKDLFIKQKLQEDKLISKNADELFNKLNNGTLFENENNQPISDNIINNVSRFTKWKRILATAASFVIVTGAANVYATSKGYQNIFFMIKYLITGEEQEITQRDEILSDRDLTISLEQIHIAKGLSITVKKLQVVDNKAKLIIETAESEIFNKSIVPLNFKVSNSENKLLCEMVSNREKQNSTYTTEELNLNNFSKNDNILYLEIYSATSQKIATLIININERSVEVLGEKEALQKISEIELKKYLGTVADYSKPNDVKGNGECINITNISYCDGLYKVDYTYFYRENKDNEKFNIDNYNIYEQVVYIDLNSDKGNNKFRFIDMENPKIIKEASDTKENDTKTQDNNQKNNTSTNSSANNTKTNKNTSAKNNTN